MAAMTAAMGCAAATYVLVVRRRQLAWGATSEESRGPLAGDELIATADLIATRAITVRASSREGLAVDRPAGAGARRVLQL